MTTKYCGTCETNSETNLEACRECGTPLQLVASTPASDVSALHGSTDKQESAVGDRSSKTQSTASTLLRFFGWAYILTSIATSVATWYFYGSRPSRPDNPSLDFMTEPNPLGIMIGIVVLVQGFLIGLIGINLADATESLLAMSSRPSERSGVNDR